MTLSIRRETEADRPAVLELLGTGLGWDTTDPRIARFLHWKHRENPFGPTPGWVAHDGARLVGVRLFLRWRFLVDGRACSAVRAVDTATHPESRGKGVFTELTLHALDELQAEGVSFVFNTPNDQSRPGYLKMGWSVVGRLPLAARPRNLASPWRMLRARVAPPASRWGVATTVGEAARDVLSDETLPAALLEPAPFVRETGWVTTDRDGAYLRWRYGLDLLGYRAFVHPRGPSEGLVVFRLRTRGSVEEATICEVLVPGADAGARRELLRTCAREIRADYVTVLDHHSTRAGFLPLPRQGPVLTWRGLDGGSMPALRSWHLGMGDVELF